MKFSRSPWILASLLMSMALLGGCSSKDSGRASSSSSSSGSSGGGGDTMSGTYEAKDADGTVVTLHFLADHKVHMIMSGSGGQKDEMDGMYQKNGDHVVVQTPGGLAPLNMDLKNGNLEGGPGMGNAMIFFKK